MCINLQNYPLSQLITFIKAENLLILAILSKLINYGQNNECQAQNTDNFFIFQLKHLKKCIVYCPFSWGKLFYYDSMHKNTCYEKVKDPSWAPFYYLLHLTSMQVNVSERWEVDLCCGNTIFLDGMVVGLLCSVQVKHSWEIFFGASSTLTAWWSFMVRIQEKIFSNTTFLWQSLHKDSGEFWKATGGLQTPFWKACLNNLVHIWGSV